MIMALIYRNVARKKTNELLLLGEQISAEEARADRDRQPGRARRGVRRRGGATGPTKLAAKSPVMMKLGKDAMFRQQDMAYADAVDFLRSQLTLAFSTEDIQEGVQGVLREARARVAGALTRPATSRLRLPEGYLTGAP